jgi:hypothetical protein
MGSIGSLTPWLRSTVLVPDAALFFIISFVLLVLSHHTDSQNIEVMGLL